MKSIRLPSLQPYLAMQLDDIHQVFKILDYFTCMVSYSSQPSDYEVDQASSTRFSLCDFPLIGLTYPMCQASIKLIFIIWVTLCGIDMDLTCHVTCHSFPHCLLTICHIQIHVISILVWHVYLTQHPHIWSLNDMIYLNFLSLGVEPWLRCWNLTGDGTLTRAEPILIFPNLI